MKRFALIVSVLAVTAGAQAQDASEFKNSGEFRVRYDNWLNRTGTKTADQEAETAARLKWNLGIRKGENIQAFASFIHNSTMGNGTGRLASSGTGAAPTGSIDTTTAADDNNLVVSRAWGWWKASDMVALKVGRMGIEIADGSVFSEDDYFAYPITHEGLNVAVDTGFAAINVYAIKTDELTAGASANSDPEQNHYILSMDFKNMPEAIKMANLLVVQTNKDAVDDTTLGSGSANWQHVGVTVGGDVGAILYKGTVAFQMGSLDKTTGAAPNGDLKVDANMFDLMVGYQMPATMGLKVTATYHQDSGDDESTVNDKNQNYQPLYNDSHNYSGLMDVVNWGNLTYVNVGAAIMPADDLEVGLGYYMFSRTNDKGNINTGAGWGGTATTTGTAPAAGSSKELGNEIDLYANKSYANDIKIGARLGMFMPGSYLKDSTAKIDQTLTEAMLQASIGF